MKFKLFALLLTAVTLFSFLPSTDNALISGAEDSLRYPEEVHLKNLRQLTFGADNAEAY